MQRTPSGTRDQATNLISPIFLYLLYRVADGSIPGVIKLRAGVALPPAAYI